MGLPALSEVLPSRHCHRLAVLAVLAVLGALSSVFLCVLALRTAWEGLLLPGHSLKQAPASFLNMQKNSIKAVDLCKNSTVTAANRSLRCLLHARDSKGACYTQVSADIVGIRWCGYYLLSSAVAALGRCPHRSDPLRNSIDLNMSRFRLSA